MDTPTTTTRDLIINALELLEPVETDGYVAPDTYERGLVLLQFVAEDGRRIAARVRVERAEDIT